MRRGVWATLPLLLLVRMGGWCDQASAGMNVNVNVGIPAVVVAEPPEMVVIPHSLVYYAPGVEVDLFFYRDYWYTRNRGRWFRANSHNGPWVVAGPRAVPVEIVRMPRDYRTVYVRGEHIPYGHLKKHWRHREHERRMGRGDWGDRDRGHSRKKHKQGRGNGHDHGD